MQTSPSPCDAPLSTATWTDQAEAWGLLPAPDPDAWHGAGGEALADDLDGDGDEDLLVTYAPDAARLYSNQGEHFALILLEGPGDAARPKQVDLDGDGDLDIVMNGSRTPIWWNEDGEWTREEGLLGDGDLYGKGPREIVAGDLDGDGDVDLVGLMNSGSDDQWRPFVWWGDGEGSFIVDTDVLGAVANADATDAHDSLARREAFDGSLIDWDDDGDLDVYVVEDMGSVSGGNVLYANEGSSFRDARIDCACGTIMDGMGVSPGDINRDGLVDLYMTGTAHSVLLLSDATASPPAFVDATLSWSADPLTEDWQMGWGSTLADLDNDGRLDLVVGLGDLTVESEPDLAQAPLPLTFLQAGASGFSDFSEHFDGDRMGSWRTTLTLDLNLDGVLDVLATDVVGMPRLFLSDGCTADEWLEVRGPRHARVELTTGTGTHVAWIQPESGYGGSGPLSVHFGLGPDARIDRVEVRTVDGRWGRIEGDIATRQTLVVGP